MKKLERVTVSDLLSISPGKSVVFILPSGASRASAMTQAYKCKLLHPRDDVEKYSCRCFEPTKNGFPVEITAVAK